ncbi:ribosome maturation factor RimP [Bacillus horti]|uniref:Ribosome maturation factor RimP n=1 Tax=Caldalkalibacillus horti TaxID=77523 RepID=A0ABT9VUZ5_9BACI|nr:ribosome maturation factor RimP [Bacillus horti]MDQ0164704.1 ribosome maturation factor RimP [Bacillus horti]
MSKKVTELTEELVTPILESKGLELVDIEFKKEGGNWFLRVYIDKDGGIDIDECGAVSEELSAQLDKLDPIPQAYFLEVSSPGAERPLKKEKDIHQAIGKNIAITTYEPIDGEKAFEGLLTQFDGEYLTLEVKVKTKKRSVTVPYDKVASAKLAVVF